jgi:hypothetical protein
VYENIENDDLVTRREFTVEAVMALLAGVTITVSGCGGGSSSSSPTPTSPSPTPTGDITGSVSANHGHTATIRAMEISAGGAVTLNIQGQATHPHTVSLTAAEVQSVGARQRVSKDSSNDSGHTHTVTFN